MAGERFVRTVLGDVPAAELGHTQTHEHLLCDLSRPLPPDAPEWRRQLDDQPIRLDNYSLIRRHRTNEDIRMTDVGDAVTEMRAYRERGGRTVVEATSVGIGRDPAGLAEVSRRTGVHVVMGCGYYCRPYHPASLDERTEREITATIVDDLTVGADGTGVRAGIIGEIGLSWPVHPVEAKVLGAATAAQRETGAALLIHPGRDERAPLDAIHRVEAAGGRLDRVVMSHVDRTLFDLTAMTALAGSGCYVEFDLFGQESSYYALADIDMPNDATRVDHIVGLTGAGYVERVLVAQDICHKTHLQTYGGEGYGHILDNVLPLMRRKGLTEDHIERITTTNPAEAVALA